jgi:hypothetical protein
MNRLAELGQKHQQAQAEKAEAQRTAVREAMPDDMLAFVDGWKEFDPDAKLTWIDTPTFKAGKEGERGIVLRDCVIGPPAITATHWRGNKT